MAPAPRGQPSPQSAIFLALLCLVLTGCPPRIDPAAARVFKGPTLPLAELVEKVNANNLAIATLRADHYFEGTIVDEKNKSHFFNGDGYLMYRRSRELLFVGRKDPLGMIVQIGSTPDRYWMTIVPEMDTMWYGSYANLAAGAPRQIPIRPDAILEVLGIAPIDSDLTRLPAPVMRFNRDVGAYMLVWNDRLPGRWYATKEIWYDARTLQPTLVLLFDADGRIVLRAYLGEHKKVQVDDQPQEQWPTMATRFRLFFPENESKLNITLSDVRLQKNGKPAEGTIRFPADPPVGRMIDVDAAQ